MSPLAPMSAILLWLAVAQAQSGGPRSCAELADDPDEKGITGGSFISNDDYSVLAYCADKDADDSCILQECSGPNCALILGPTEVSLCICEEECIPTLACTTPGNNNITVQQFCPEPPPKKGPRNCSELAETGWDFGFFSDEFYQDVFYCANASAEVTVGSDDTPLDGDFCFLFSCSKPGCATANGGEGYCSCQGEVCGIPHSCTTPLGTSVSGPNC
ncbi:unnamed protein product [Cercospora beticola]|nr:unnamed protein product [Cercospora beticola]